MKFELQTLEVYSDEALLSEIRRVAELLNGARLTLKRFNAMARVHSTTLRYRFGSWQAALDRAGISKTIAPRYKIMSRQDVSGAISEYAENPGESVTRDTIAARLSVDANNLTKRFGKWEALLKEVGLTPVPLGRRFSEEECFENILVLWIHYGRQPHFAELKQPPSTVGPKAYLRRWVGWRAALAAFVKRMNEEVPVFADSTPTVVIGKADKSQSNTVNSPRSISLSLRYKVLARDKFRCVACGSSPAKDVRAELHVDHIIPWSRGGKNAEENLRTLCLTCNLGKGARMDIEGTTADLS